MIVAVRAGSVLTATEKETFPLPLPLDDPAASTIQSAPLDAVHAQLLPDALTVIDPVPPADANDCPVGASV